MPFSSERGKPFIKEIVSRLPHERILDIGAGCGTYARMFPNSHKTAIEIWPAYITKYDLMNLYDVLHCEDARTWEPDGHYDVAFAGDVLEHMTKQEAFNLLMRVADYSTTQIVSIPIGYYPQGEYEGNPYERHITDNWTHEDVCNLFGVPQWHRIDW